jgi:hypothetical protein
LAASFDGMVDQMRSYLAYRFMLGLSDVAALKNSTRAGLAPERARRLSERME